MNRNILYDINSLNVMHLSVKLEHLMHIPNDVNRTMYIVKNIMNMNEHIPNIFFSRDVNDKCVYIYEVETDTMFICNNSNNDVLNTLFRVLLHGIINDNRVDLINEIADKKMSLKKFMITHLMIRL